MNKRIFVLTADYPIFDNAHMPIIVAMREPKAEIEALYQAYLTQGKPVNIKSVNVDFYTLEIRLGNTTPPMILANGMKKPKLAEWAIDKFKVLFPAANFRIIQFKDVFLYKQRTAIGLEGVKQWLN
ncbi:hypothetical protein [Rodentibacter caecimuris]|uniref:hypothetical protein n=1 Tax=Rodentibacter caecimuris TaxID=1796644 RepID=UPI0013A0A5CA|nr:hypothetical protein [Rodentibacter heylii]QIA77690.1 hypothetical protein FEE42_10235 [Rodentibacter heylii]